MLPINIINVNFDRKNPLGVGERYEAGMKDCLGVHGTTKVKRVKKTGTTRSMEITMGL